MKTNIITKAGLAAFAAIVAATGVTAPSFISASAEEEAPAAAETRAVGEAPAEETEAEPSDNSSAEDSSAPVITKTSDGSAEVTAEVEENADLGTYTYVTYENDGEIKVYTDEDAEEMTFPSGITYDPDTGEFSVDIDDGLFGGAETRTMISKVFDTESGEEQLDVTAIDDDEFKAKLSEEEYGEYIKTLDRLDELDRIVFGDGSLSKEETDALYKETDAERAELFEKLSSYMIKVGVNSDDKAE